MPRLQGGLFLTHALPRGNATFQGILLVYDVTDRGSFNSIRNWVGQIQQHADVHVNKILIGNKCDMEEQRVVSVEEGKQLAKEYAIQFFETSAKNDIEVETVRSTMLARKSQAPPLTRALPPPSLKGFTTVAREVKNRLIADGPARPAGGGGGIKPGAAKPAGKKGCC